MGRKGVKIPNETKLKYAKLCSENKMSKSETAQHLGVYNGDVRTWVKGWEYVTDQPSWRGE